MGSSENLERVQFVTEVFNKHVCNKKWHLLKLPFSSLPHQTVEKKDDYYLCYISSGGICWNPWYTETITAREVPSLMPRTRRPGNRAKNRTYSNSVMSFHVVHIQEKSELIVADFSML